MTGCSTCRPYRVGQLCPLCHAAAKKQLEERLHLLEALPLPPRGVRPRRESRPSVTFEEDLDESIDWTRPDAVLDAAIRLDRLCYTSQRASFVPKARVVNRPFPTRHKSNAWVS